MFRKPVKKDIDPIVDFIASAAASGHFEPALAQEDARAGIRKNLITIMKRGRRTDKPLCAQLLIWEVDGEAAGFFISSSIVGKSGNEIFATGIYPEYRGRGEGTRMKQAVVDKLHSKVDLYSRCLPASERSYRINTRLGFRTIGTMSGGARIMHLPKVDRAFTGERPSPDQLDPFTEISVR